MNTTQPPSTESDFRKYKRWFKADAAHLRKWRETAEEDFDFVAGEQWSEDDKQILRDQMRPVITFNRVHPMINAISGMEISNRKEVKYFPREAGDARADEVLTDAAKWFRDVADTDDEDSDAFLDTCVCGVGWTETRLDFEENDQGEPTMAAVNPLEMLWDKSARRKNLTDARRVWRVRKVATSIAQEMFPDAEKTDLNARWASLDLDKDSESELSQEEKDRYISDGTGEDDDEADENEEVTLVHLQYKDKVTEYVVKDPATGKSANIPEADYKKLSERAAMLGIQFQATKRQVTKVKNVFIGGKILHEGMALSDKYFSYQPITAYMDRTNGQPYGLMRLMKEPQRWSNKWMSQSLHILNSMAKGGLMYETGAVENVREFEKNWARPDIPLQLADGALSNGKIKEKPVAQMPASFFQLMELAISAVRDVTGINVELLGMREANQPASLEYQRRQAGMSIMAPMFDNLHRYRRDHGKLMLYLIQNYLNDGRLVRIVGEAGAQYVPLALKADLEYDIIVDDQVNSPDQKLMVWQMITPFLSILPPQVQLALIDYAPLPQSVIEAIKKAASQLGPSQQQQMMEKLTADKAASETEVNMARAQSYIASAQKDMAAAGQTGNAPDLAALQDQWIKAAEVQQNGQIQNNQLAQNAQLTREKLANQLQMHREKLMANARPNPAQMGMTASQQSPNLAPGQ